MLLTATLSGCYVEVGHENGNGTYTDVHFARGITQFSTQLLVDTSITPIMVAGESAAMVINPEAYTTPRTRSQTRASVVETSYSYLFDNWDCTFGGYTKVSAEKNTTTYSDGFVFVDIELNSKAQDCNVLQNNVRHQLNSNFNYDVTGYYDDVAKRLSSVNAALQGWLEIEYAGKEFRHTNIDLAVGNVSSSELTIAGGSRIKVDNSIYTGSARLVTANNVYIYVGSNHPHDGTVRLSDGSEWVSLAFEASGVWRNDSNGYSYYASWSELGY